GDDLDFYRQLLAKRKETKKVGGDVARMLSRASQLLLEENIDLRAKLERWGGFRARLLEHGIDPENRWAHVGERMIDELAGHLSQMDLNHIRNAGRKIAYEADMLAEKLYRNG
ncbi:MAG: hypothetical protein IMY75_01485, partial [Chloroflexi bacterium]|nr:hypothetical protein [Chloroflexota bacterium]